MEVYLPLYVNSVLQTVAALPELYNLLKSLPTSFPPYSLASNLSTIFSSFTPFLRPSRMISTHSLEPNGFYNFLLRSRLIDSAEGRQCDAHECFLAVLQTMSEEFEQFSSSVDYLRKIFSGKTREFNVYQDSTMSDFRDHSFTDLQVDVENVTNLQSAVKNFFKGGFKLEVLNF